MQQLPPRISRYEIKALIGAGGMGSLYLARDTNPTTNRLVALKLLKATLDSHDLRERFAREARALAALNHPNIVDIYDSGEFQGSPFIVMEYVRGESLAEKIKRNAGMSIGEKLKLMAELCSGLAHAHEAGIIHRDIKPANLMVDPHGRLKILDFGIARVGEGTYFGGEMTLLNVRIGTPGYMSPEQIEGGEIDRRSDIFAAGAVCYALLAYREAFPGADTRQVEYNVRQGRPVRLSSLVPGLDPGIEEVVSKALAPDPRNRYQDASQFEEALERQRWKLGLAETPASSGRTTPAPAREAGVVLSHESRADAAYQRAMAVYQQGAVEAARRFAMEALAEDPGHERARALMQRLDANAAPPPPPAAARPPVPPPSPPAAPRPLVPPTPPDDGDDSEKTMLASGIYRGDSFDLDASEPTLLSTPAALPGAGAARTGRDAPWTGSALPKAGGSALPGAARPLPAGPGNPLLAGSASSLPAGARPGASAKPAAAPAKPQPARAKARTAPSMAALWARHGKTLQVAGIAVAVLALAGLAVLLVMKLLMPAGPLLTVTRPTGGTVWTTGISCGSSASDCTANIAEGQTVQLRAQPDPGYAFAGFGGDCTSSGAVHMTRPSTCVATFTPLPADASAGTGAGGKATWALTVVKPANGMVVGPGGIRCGSVDSACSVQYPEGTEVTLAAYADLNFAFRGFTGDCTANGATVMKAARTCGATFVAEQRAGANTPVPPSGPLPRDRSARASSRGGGAAGGGIDALPTNAGVGNTVDPLAPPATDVKERVAPPLSPEELAKKDILKLLEEYRDAYERLDLKGIQRTWPTAPLPRLNVAFSSYKSLKYAIQGAPEFVDVDAGRGVAHVKAKYLLTPEVKVGTQPPYKREEVFNLEQRNGVWLIRDWSGKIVK